MKSAFMSKGVRKKLGSTNLFGEGSAIVAFLLGRENDLLS